MAEKDTKPQILSEEAINTLIATDAFKEKAIKSIIATQSLYDNILKFDAQGILFRLNEMSMEYIFSIAFNLNGNLIKANGKIDMSFLHGLSDRYAIEAKFKEVMYDSVALAIAKELFKTNNDSISIFAKQALKGYL